MDEGAVVAVLAEAVDEELARAGAEKVRSPGWILIAAEIPAKSENV